MLYQEVPPELREKAMAPIFFNWKGLAIAIILALPITLAVDWLMDRIGELYRYWRSR
jgi:hypothetical protein